MGVRCWKCGSKNVTVTVMNQQSYSVGKGIAGTLLLGPGGAAMGVNGKSEEKIKYVCQACGEVSSVCMSPNMSQQIDEEIAEGNSILLPSLKSSYPNIEWEPCEEEEEEKPVDLSKVIYKIDKDIVEELITEISEPTSLVDLRKKLARTMRVDENNISLGAISSRIEELAEEMGIIEFNIGKIHY